jgi:hypothetical protein
VNPEQERVAGFGRLEDGLRQASDWYLWGPYVSERQWGTVREDYSADGEAWDYFPHDHARSRAYRWGEDGLAGFCDIEQRLCLGLSLWNGRDPILKERIFGLTGAQGNHGEDAKEYWWYVDALPSHAWNRWRYHYPQAAFPYGDLIAENGRRGKLDPEYELFDTGAFDDDRYWIVEVDYAKATPFDVLMTVRVTNAGPDAETLHVLPTAWFRNTWSWDLNAAKPEMRSAGATRLDIDHPFFGDLELLAGPSGDGGEPVLLLCDNETNTERLYGFDSGSSYPKDAINDHVVHGASTVNPDGIGTKGSFWYQLSVPAGQTTELRLRLRPRAAKGTEAGVALGSDFDAVTKAREGEADEFYAALTPADASADEARVMRQAFAGMLWCKQLFYYDIQRWLAGDPTQPKPPDSRLTGRNSRWRAFDALDIMSMPDKWEYPWFAAWDLAFHCVALAHVDPAFAKYQLILLCREWFQHADGALPAYEWSFDDVNPPVQAWAALEVFAIDGARDVDFLRRVFDKLLVNFTWWVNRKDASGCNLFEGGFMGLDNIGPIDRSHLPLAGTLQQSDATSWMALFAIDMGTMATVLRRHGQPTLDLVIKFLEHFAQIRRAMDEQGLWDDDDGIYYDRLVLADGEQVPIKVRSLVGILPMLGSVLLEEGSISRAQHLGKQFATLRDDRDVYGELSAQGLVRGAPGHRRLLLGLVGVDKVNQVLGRLFAEDEFLSPYGLRAVSQYHRDHPYELVIGDFRASIDYEPAESTTNMFGGNSNWRGPIWFPLNYLLVSSIVRYGQFFGDEVTIEYPTGSGAKATLLEVAGDLRHRLVSLFLLDEEGRRPCFGSVEKFQTDPRWRDYVWFNEYFHGDTGAGLGASHQTGWTGLVADLIRRRPGSGIQSITDLLRPADFPPPVSPTP